MNEAFAVYGAAGCGRSLMPVAAAQLKQLSNPNQAMFIDDSLDLQSTINDRIAMNYEQFKDLDCANKHVLIAIADSNIRQKIANRLSNDGISLWSVQDRTTLIMERVVIGIGAAISPFVTIASNVTIGKCFHANLYSYVEHDCVIGDYVTFAPRVSCNGNVHIHDHAYIGAGAILKQGRPGKPLVIGTGAVVGMGAVVTRDVPAGAVVVGNPARILNKQVAVKPLPNTIHIQ